MLNETYPSASDIVENTLRLTGHTGTPTTTLEPVVVRECSMRDAHTFTGVSDLVVIPHINSEGPPRLLVFTRASPFFTLQLTRTIRLSEDLNLNYAWHRVLGARVTARSNLTVVGDRSFSGTVRYVAYHSFPNLLRLMDRSMEPYEIARSQELPYGTSVSVNVPPPDGRRRTTKIASYTGGSIVGAASSSDNVPGGASDNREVGLKNALMFETRNQAASTMFPWATTASTALAITSNTEAAVVDLDLMDNQVADDLLTSVVLKFHMTGFLITSSAAVNGNIQMYARTTFMDGASYDFPLGSLTEGITAAALTNLPYGNIGFVSERINCDSPIQKIGVYIKNNLGTNLTLTRAAGALNRITFEIEDYSVSPPKQAIVFEGLDASLTHNLLYELRCALELGPTPSTMKLVTPVNYAPRRLDYEALHKSFLTSSTLSLLGGHEAYEKHRHAEIMEKIGVSGVYELAGTAAGLASGWLAPEFTAGLKRGLCATDPPPEGPPLLPPPVAEAPAELPDNEGDKVGLCMEGDGDGGVDIDYEPPLLATAPVKCPNLASNAEDPTLRRVTDSLLRGDRKATVRSLREERGYYHCSNRFAYLVDGVGYVGTVSLSDVPPKGDYNGKPVATVEEDGLRTVIHAPPVFEGFAAAMREKVAALRPPAGTQSLTNAPNLYVQVYAPGVAKLEQNSWQLAFCACLAALPIAAVLAGAVDAESNVVARLSADNAKAKLKAANQLGLPLITAAGQFKSGPRSPGPDLVMLRDHDISPVAFGLQSINLLVVYAMVVNMPKPAVKKDTQVLLGAGVTTLPAGTVIPSAARPVQNAQSTPQVMSSIPLVLDIPKVFQGVVGSTTYTVDSPESLNTLVAKVASIKGNRADDGKPIWRPSYENSFKRMAYNNALGGEPNVKSPNAAERRTDSYVIRAAVAVSNGEEVPKLQTALESIAEQTRERAKKGTGAPAIPKAKQAAAARLANVAFEDDELFD